MTLAVASTYALFQSSLHMDFHRAVIDTLESKHLREDTPHEQVPTLILHDDAVWREVHALLGPNATPDPCRHIHTNSHPEDGPWHQDNYDEGPWPVGVEFAIMFYFPQDTPPEMGGTAVMIDGQEIIGAGPAGTCLLARGGDVVHRARANTTGQQRYMLKYLFRAAV